MTTTSYCPFVVGQHVVCVDAEATNSWFDRELVLGAVYVLRWVGKVKKIRGQRNAYNAETVGVRLTEVTREDGDPPFAASRFRPAPSIAALRDIAARAPELEPAQ